jgi:acid phosphatase (class A)
MQRVTGSARRWILLAALAVLGGCAASEPQAPPEGVEEIAPGFLRGYLTEETQLNSMVFVPPVPSPQSARQALDSAWAKQMLDLHDSGRWRRAIGDADLTFPAAAEIFSCALGVPISETQTPALYLLLRRTLTDLGLATYSAKNAYQRERPFMVNGEPICTPDDEQGLRSDGSYPSGHTAIGWGWALLLTELSPDHAEELLARGRAFGESRNVCNVHWYSDVVAGRLVAAGAVAKLHANDEFLEAMAAAQVDIDAVRAAGLPPVRDCAAEVDALSQPLTAEVVK